MRFRRIRCLSPAVLLILKLEAPGQDAPSPRLPVPDAAVQKRVEKMVRDLFKDEYARKGPADQQALARKLLQQGRDTKDDPAVRYVLFREGMDLAARVGDVATALEAADEMGRLYEADGLTLKIQALTASAGAARTPEAAGALVEACLQAADEAVAADRFKEAKVLAGKAESAAKAARDASLVRRVQRRGDEIEELERQQKEVRDAQKGLEANPNDPDALLVLGRYALLKGNLEKALPMLSRGADTALRVAAEKELAAPPEARGQAEVGDAWWEAAEKEKNVALKEVLLGRARENYEKALAGLSGFGKTRVEKRLAELDSVPASSRPGSAGGAKGQLILDLGGGVKMEFLYVRPGVFTMGGTETPAEKPPHRVEITKGFYLGKYEVTRGQFAAFARATGHKTDAEKEGKAWGFRADRSWGEIAGATWQNPVVFKQTDDHPVVCVSWNDTDAFCKWLAGRAKRAVRLPTEAEWEYACRAGTATRWSFGDEEGKFADYGWCGVNSGMQTHPVGQKKPNPWGLYDMHGNAWEWVQDWYGPYGGDAKDPEGPSSGQDHVQRGGVWDVPAVRCRSAGRHIDAATPRSTTIGFRACLR